MKLAFLIPLLSTAAFAQITDGGFELGTFDTSVRTGTPVTFVDDSAEAYEGNRFGEISAVASQSGLLRTLTTFDAGLVEAGAVYIFSFYAKTPMTNGFEVVKASAGGGGSEAPVSRATLEAPTSLTGVWMIHSYQFNIPANWNPENALLISLSTEPISPVIAGQSYSFFLDGMTLSQIEASLVPEPQAAALATGLFSLVAGAIRRRRSSH